MKIKLGEQILEVVSAVSDNNRLRIQVDETSDAHEFLLLIENNTTMLYMDDDENIVQTFDGGFTLNSVEQSNGAMYYNLQMPTEAEKAKREIERLKETITNLELALCEIYESMMG